uniref:CX domain-containing protein n=1 Tax=Rhabditophanes sp. KR3021 TaxID=114890 RepID=A0AC35U4L9_9BILA
MLVGAGVGSISGYSVGSSHRRYYDNNVNSNGNVETEVPHTFFYDNTMFSFINEDFYYDGYLLDTKCEKSLSELIEEEKNFSSNTNNTSTDSINGNILESNERIDPSDGLNSLPKIENATIPTSLDRTFDNSNETLYWTNLRFPNGSVPNTIFWGCRYQEICCTDKKCCAQDLSK